MRDIDGLGRELLTQILDAAESFAALPGRPVKKVPLLRGRIITNLFFEDSTRTRTTFELAAKLLSADVINFNVRTSATSKGETLLDTLRNIVADGRISLMFIVPGSHNVVRVNGRAVVSVAPDLLGRFDQKGHQPRSVIVVTIGEIYSQCARALMRAGLWTAGDESAGLPTLGEILAAQKDGFDGVSYDAAWGARAKDTMW